MNELYRKLKLLTGYKKTDIAREFNVSKQFISQSFQNYSLAYINSNKFMINTMIDKKIIELGQNIEALMVFKKEVNEYKEENHR